MNWRSKSYFSFDKLSLCEDFRMEGLNKFPTRDIRLWFDPSKLPPITTTLTGVKIGDSIYLTGQIDGDHDPVYTARVFYNRAGRFISQRGDFDLSWTLSHPDWAQKKGYEDSLAIGVIWTKTGCPPGLSFNYNRAQGSRAQSDLDYAVQLFQDLATAGNIPAIPKRDGDTIHVATTAHCDFVSDVLKEKYSSFHARGFTGDFIDMVEGVKSVLDRHDIRVISTRWHLAPYIEALPDRVPEDPPGVMAKKFLNIICGADLPADRYEVQAHFSFTSVEGLEFVRAFCGPKNEFLFPLVELTPEKGMKVLVSIGVKPEGYYLQLASRKDLKPEFLTSLEARFDTTFQPVPKPGKTSRRKK